MTPQARIAAAISILDQLSVESTPVDRALKSWARSNRYAGSKDRRAIAAHIYHAIRHAHQAASLMATTVYDGRALMLGSLVLDDMEAADISALFDGGKFGPEPLSARELEVLEQGRTSDLLTGLPEEIGAALTVRAAGEEHAAIGALLDRAPLDIRVNTLSGKSDKALSLLEEGGLKGAAISGLPNAYRFEDAPRLKDSEAYKSGLVEIQDAGSQIASSLIPAKTGETVVDYCAGGGGKSLAIAALLGGKGQVFAHDIAPKRLESLARRADRAKARNIQIFDDAEKLTTQIAQMKGADHVVLDVPCSGSGAWRRNPETLWRFTDERLAELSGLQRSILQDAAPLVKTGGTLTYITCSFLPRENEQAIEWFLAENKDFAVEPLDGERPAGLIPGTVQLMPHLTQTDGFFIARLRRAC